MALMSNKKISSSQRSIRQDLLPPVKRFMTEINLRVMSMATPIFSASSHAFKTLWALKDWEIRPLTSYDFAWIGQKVRHYLKGLFLEAPSNDIDIEVSDPVLLQRAANSEERMRERVSQTLPNSRTQERNRRVPLPLPLDSPDTQDYNSLGLLGKIQEWALFPGMLILDCVEAFRQAYNAEYFDQEGCMNEGFYREASYGPVAEPTLTEELDPEHWRTLPLESRLARLALYAESPERDSALFSPAVTNAMSELDKGPILQKESKHLSDRERKLIEHYLKLGKYQGLEDSPALQAKTAVPKALTDIRNYSLTWKNKEAAETLEDLRASEEAIGDPDSWTYVYALLHYKESFEIHYATILSTDLIADPGSPNARFLENYKWFEQRLGLSSTQKASNISPDFPTLNNPSNLCWMHTVNALIFNYEPIAQELFKILNTGQQRPTAVQGPLLVTTTSQTESVPFALRNWVNAYRNREVPADLSLRLERALLSKYPALGQVGQMGYPTEYLTVLQELKIINAPQHLVSPSAPEELQAKKQALEIQMQGIDQDRSLSTPELKSKRREMIQSSLKFLEANMQEIPYQAHVDQDLLYTIWIYPEAIPLKRVATPKGYHLHGLIHFGHDHFKTFMPRRGMWHALDDKNPSLKMKFGEIPQEGYQAALFVRDPETPISLTAEKPAPPTDETSVHTSQMPAS